jgi:hypothetical protein
MNSDPWTLCPCGHMMLLHDVEDLDGTNPTCCVEGCNQQGCSTDQVGGEP